MAQIIKIMYSSNLRHYIENGKDQYGLYAGNFKIRKFIDYNIFSAEAVDIPDDVTWIPTTLEERAKFYPTKPKASLTTWEMNIKPLLTGGLRKWANYSIYNTCKVCHIVWVGAKEVIICKLDDASYVADENAEEIWPYSVVDRIYRNPLAVFIGTSGQDEYTGNTILVQFSGHKYAFIGSQKIYEFETKDRIRSLYSPISCSRSYPVAVGDDRIYFMNDMEYIERKDVDENAAGLYDYNIYYVNKYRTIIKAFDFN
jgi:hypothetical protein